MNFALVSKLLAMVMLILSIAFALSLGASFIWDSPDQAGKAQIAFLTSAISAMVAGGAFYLASRGASQKFFRKEALAAIGLGWLMASLAGSIPYIMLVPEIGFSGAVFESTSGLTTTGASVLSNLENFTPSLLFWRALSQGIGGMGVIVFFVAILESIGVGAKMLYANEASGSVADFDDSRTRSVIRKLVYLYAGLNAACMLCYKIAGMSWFDAICHALPTVATGGFSTRSASIAAFDSAFIEGIAIVFMLAGATSFLLIIRSLNSRRNHFRKDTEFIAYISFAAIAIVAIATMLMIEGDDTSLGLAFRHSAFQVASIISTTGFATQDFAAWSTLPQMLLLSLMILGGCAGSTAGGLKITRVIVAFQACLNGVRRSFRANLVQRIRINGHALSDRIVNEMLAYIVLVAFVCIGSIIVASLLESKHSLVTNESAVIACLFNIGPGLKDVGPSENYAFFQAHTKIFLSFLMILGRLEMYAVLALFMPSIWKRFK